MNDNTLYVIREKSLLDDGTSKLVAYCYSLDDAARYIKDIALYRAWEFAGEDGGRVEGRVLDSEDAQPKRECFFAQNNTPGCLSVVVAEVKAIERGWIWSNIDYVPRPVLELWVIPVSGFSRKKWRIPDLVTNNEGPVVRKTTTETNTGDSELVHIRAMVCQELRKAVKAHKPPDVSHLP